MMDQQEIKKRANQILEEDLGKDRTYRYKIKFPSQYELYKELLNYPKEDKMPEKELGADDYVTTFDRQEEVSMPFEGSLERIDEKHWILHLGCKKFIVHNVKQITDHVEREVTEWMESLKREKRVADRRKRLTKSMDKTKPKKKVLPKLNKYSKGDHRADATDTK